MSSNIGMNLTVAPRPQVMPGVRQNRFHANLRFETMTMNENLERIKTDFEAFSRRIESYRANVSNPDRHKDCCEAAYEGLYKLIQRIKKELRSKSLSDQESRICRDICGDQFLNGLLQLRHVATHIQNANAMKRKSVEIYVPSGQLVGLPYEVSAGSAFSERDFKLPQSSHGINKIDHLENLDAAKERIAKKLKEILPI